MIGDNESRHSRFSLSPRNQAAGGVVGASLANGDSKKRRGLGCRLDVKGFETEAVPESQGGGVHDAVGVRLIRETQKTEEGGSVGSQGSHGLSPGS